MATVATSTSNFSSTVVALVAKQLEAALRANYPHTTPGNYIPAEMMNNGFNALTYVAYADLAVATTALTEGTTPTSQAFTISVDQCTATQVGGVLEITDLALVQSPHNLMAVAGDKIADQGAHTIDQMVREILAAGTSVIYATGSARSTQATSNVLTGALIKKAVARLKTVNVKPFADGFYRAIITPAQEYDLQTDTATGGWIDVYKYTDNLPLITGESGRYAGVRFQVSSTAKVFATAGASSANVASAILFGPDAYVIGDMQTLRGSFVAPGGDHGDPLGQKALVGWKCSFGSMLADANGPRYIRIETGTTLDAAQG